MYIQVYSLLAVFVVATICDATSDTAQRDAFYKHIGKVSRSLDPRDYIVDPEVSQSYKYNNAHMDMIGEMTIFYYAEAVANKTVTLSLTCSEQRDYKAKFEFCEKGVYMIEGHKAYKNVNYARVDGEMMRFYVCFLGKLCPKNAVNVKHPLTHFKLESNDINALMRIFIKGLMFGMHEHVDNPSLSHEEYLYNSGYINFPHYGPEEFVCYFRVYRGAGFVIKLKTFIMSGPVKLKSYSVPIQIRFLALRFALLMIITNDITKERVAHQLLTAEELPTHTVSFTLRGDGFVHVCQKVYH